MSRSKALRQLAQLADQHIIMPTAYSTGKFPRAVQQGDIRSTGARSRLRIFDPARRFDTYAIIAGAFHPAMFERVLVVQHPISIDGLEPAPVDNHNGT